jgi:hypothetical protein
VLNLADGLPADCQEAIDNLENALLEGDVATDVVIADGIPVVTVGEPESLEVRIADVSSCLLDHVECEECVANVDLDAGIMEIPCVNVNGKMYTVIMEQRGNSMNWKVTIVHEKEGLLNYRHNGDD